MRRWFGIALAIMLALPLVATLVPPAEANPELHPGARLFYPLWDVSTPNRLTFIVVTRENQRDSSGISAVPTGTIIGGVPTIINRFKISGTPGNCVPRGAGGSSNNINRTDLGGTSASPIFVDDVHFEYYGKSCSSADETVHMSCADIDLFLLASPDNASGLRPRFAFSTVAAEGRGALDVHLVNNGTFENNRRKSATIAPVRPGRGGTGDKQHDIRPSRNADNSLMGHAIISDLAEGWAATYPAAAARTTSCGACAAIDGGTKVGYDNYPMEVFLPFALTDPFPAPGGGLRNVLSLWGPGMLPGENLGGKTINISFRWWDGRERKFDGSRNSHSLIAPLGGNTIAGLDSPLAGATFNVTNFVCGHATSSGKAENDGFPRAGSNASACGVPDVPDTAHPSDNFESGGETNQEGSTIQSSTPIGWWRFTLRRDGQVPVALNEMSPGDFDHSGRGLVGVVLSYTPGASGNGVGDATRLWHKLPCEVSASGQVYGPLHGGIMNEEAGASPNDVRATPVFNAFDFRHQRFICVPD